MKQKLRKLLELAYNQAWSSNGSAEQRDDFNSLYKSLLKKFKLGSFTYCGNGKFKWSKD